MTTTYTGRMSLKADIAPAKGQQESEIPEVVPIFPMAEHVLMPGVQASYRVFEPRYRVMLEDLMQHAPDERWIAIPCLAESWRERFDGYPSFHRVATIAKIDSVELGEDHHTFVSTGVARILLTEVGSDLSYRMAEATRFIDVTPPLEIVREKTYELLQATMALLGAVGSISEEFDEILASARDLDEQVFALGAILIQGPAERQQFIEDRSICGRIDRLSGTMADLILMLSLRAA